MFCGLIVLISYSQSILFSISIAPAALSRSVGGGGSDGDFGSCPITRSILAIVISLSIDLDCFMNLYFTVLLGGYSSLSERLLRRHAKKPFSIAIAL